MRLSAPEVCGSTPASRQSSQWRCVFSTLSCATCQGSHVHSSNGVRTLRLCVTPSLVLLDEAGTGTDPEEGSALGVAIVDHFRSKGAQVIASTHYRGLKMYAANDESIINASVEFDERTLQPTYKLLLGLAGASSGIEIARRFGIDQTVIDAARENLVPIKIARL